jgi:tRNA pseudouridine38-40 synthase
MRKLRCPSVSRCVSVDTIANWLLSVAYDGSRYSGWQIQPQQLTVQGTIQRHLSSLFSTDVTIFGCSRTDAGVHALSQKITFHPPEHPRINPEIVKRALNQLLPKDIRIQEIEQKPIEFHARFNAKGKIYSYVIFQGQIQSPFMRNFCWSIQDKLHIEQMQTAAEGLIGEHDFTAFSVTSRGQHVESFIRTICQIKISAVEKFIVISVSGDGFLYKMVRRIIGFLVAVGRGRPIDKADVILKSRNRNSGFDTAPPQGLYLEKVFYDDDDMAGYTSLKLPFLAFLGLD